MRKLAFRVLPPVFAVVLFWGAASRSTEPAAPRLAHMVYFTLKDDSPASRAKLVAACEKYLSGHEGTVHFSTGTLADDMKRDVNDRDFDVALNLVFKSKAAHDTYQSHPRHLSFIEENQSDWAKVRVFDSYLSER